MGKKSFFIIIVFIVLKFWAFAKKLNKLVISKKKQVTRAIKNITRVENSIIMPMQNHRRTYK
jgi:hypothetical protein